MILGRQVARSSLVLNIHTEFALVIIESFMIYKVPSLSCRLSVSGIVVMFTDKIKKTNT